MSANVDFYYDYGSPAAYLAWTQIPSICADHVAELTLKPILLGGVFKATGNDTPVRIKPKGAWLFDDMRRYARKYGVRFEMNPHFIINTLALMRGAIWARETGVLEAYDAAMFTAVWVDGRNMEDPAEIAAVLEHAGLDPAEMAEAIATPEIKQALIAETEAAVERGIFGVPTMFVAGEMHFGQDRLDWVDQALSRQRP